MVVALMSLPNLVFIVRIFKVFQMRVFGLTQATVTHSHNPIFGFLKVRCFGN